ncbi:MAG: ATP-binding cassette domain-containing protein, partial [Clostridiales bacterium]|nr:ATP-binding cassette domain-containing protein [Clostridiales bacterium]
MEQIKITGLSFSYPNANGTGLSDMNLSVQKGDFILLFGRSGCGKSTFLKQLKPVIAPFGKRKGSIEFCGRDINSLSHREQSTAIGYVSQNPDNPIVPDKVWH